MELKEFVKTAIADITSAVSELQEELKNGAIVSPSYPNVIANSTIADPENKKVNRKISQVDFDVALTVGDSESSMTPLWNDPMTIETLDKIVYSIHLRKYTLEEFSSFVKENLGKGDFAWECLRYVRGRV